MAYIEFKDVNKIYKTSKMELKVLNNVNFKIEKGEIIVITGPSKSAGNRQQEVSDISRNLKTMALELGIPVIALAQLSRAVEQREDKRPIMSDLRESGSIEQDADIVSFLYRDDYYNKEARREDNASISEFIIGKNRSGPTTTVELLFKKDTSTFVNFQRESGE